MHTLSNLKDPGFPLQREIEQVKVAKEKVRAIRVVQSKSRYIHC